MNFCKLIKILFLGFVGYLPVTAFTQVLYPGYHLTEYYKVLDLQNPELSDRIFVRPSNVAPVDSLPEWNPWGDAFKFDIRADKSFRVLPVIGNINYNSRYPRGYNDGPVWKGKGFNADLNFGFRGNVGLLHYTFAPVVYTVQNQAFPYVYRGRDQEEFSYQFLTIYGIDWVQRYGSSSFTRVHPGQSDIRLIYKKLTLGISNQNVILGPAHVNPIILSNHAPMFPHIDFGTDTPIETPIGRFEFRSFWGMMNESEYYDDNPANDRRYFQGGGLFWEPSFMPGFALGMSRIHYRDWDIHRFTFSDVFLSFADFSSNQDTLSNGHVVNDLYDQMIAANFRWRFEEVGFEAYLELARNDFSNFRSLAQEPEHSRAYTIGFAKVFELGADKGVKMGYEHTTLGRSRLASIRMSPSYYVHHLSPGGYTHRGQILGAGIGPGSNGDFGEVSYYFPEGMYGLSFQRIRFNDDFAFETFDPEGDRPFDVEYTFTAKAHRFLPGGFSLGGELAYSNRLNWYYIPDNNVGNLYVQLVFSYQLETN